jgi:hypothetical protein
MEGEEAAGGRSSARTQLGAPLPPLPSSATPLTLRREHARPVPRRCYPRPPRLWPGPAPLPSPGPPPRPPTHTRCQSLAHWDARARAHTHRHTHTHTHILPGTRAHTQVHGEHTVRHAHTNKRILDRRAQPDTKLRHNIHTCKIRILTSMMVADQRCIHTHTCTCRIVSARVHTCSHLS